jgi:hypothetical protein
LVAKDFNPNERTEYQFRKGLFRYLLADQLMLCINSYYRAQTLTAVENEPVKTLPSIEYEPIYVLQCARCLTLVNPQMDGSEEYGAGEKEVCSVCDSDFRYFKKVDQAALESSPVGI